MRAFAIVFALLLALVAVPSGRAESGAAATPGFVMIVNPLNPVTSVDRKFVRDAYLKRVQRWPSGEPVYPADLANQAVHKLFVERVMDRTVVALRMHWQQVIFSGRAIPPPELENEHAVVRYVLKYPGGLAYVANPAAAGGARVVELR